MSNLKLHIFREIIKFVLIKLQLEKLALHMLAKTACNLGRKMARRRIEHNKTKLRRVSLQTFLANSQTFLSNIFSGGNFLALGNMEAKEQFVKKLCQLVSQHVPIRVVRFFLILRNHLPNFAFLKMTSPFLGIKNNQKHQILTKKDQKIKND